VATTTSPPETRPEAQPVIERPLGSLMGKVAALYRQAVAERLKNERWLRDAGFRPPCLGALYTIAARQPLSQRELSKELWLDPSDLVAVLDILENAGFVSRRRDPNDRRRHQLTLTPQGKKAAKRLADLLDGIDDEVLGPMPERDRHLLRRLLDGVVTYHR
jgi:DNA-binding MarR family transcriptional regulator